MKAAETAQTAAQNHKNQNFKTAFGVQRYVQVIVNKECFKCAGAILCKSCFQASAVKILFVFLVSL